MDPMSGFNIRLVFTLPPSDSTKDVYTSEITFLALNPWIYLGYGYPSVLAGSMDISKVRISICTGRFYGCI